MNTIKTNETVESATLNGADLLTDLNASIYLIEVAENAINKECDKGLETVLKLADMYPNGIQLGTQKRVAKGCMPYKMAHDAAMAAYTYSGSKTDEKIWVKARISLYRYCMETKSFTSNSARHRRKGLIEQIESKILDVEKSLADAKDKNDTTTIIEKSIELNTLKGKLNDKKPPIAPKPPKTVDPTPPKTKDNVDPDPKLSLSTAFSKDTITKVSEIHDILISTIGLSKAECVALAQHLVKLYC